MAGVTDVVAVVTQPDRPAGRGRNLAATPVKSDAVARGLRVFEPERLRPFVDTLRALEVEALAVASYGRILPQALLDVPPMGAFNVHPSLLPLYRGATPLQSAIRDGRTQTGVTIIMMDVGMDTGDVLLREETPLGACETYGELHDRLAIAGAALLVRALQAAMTGTLQRRPQSALGVSETEIAATVTRPIAKADLVIPFDRSPQAVVDFVRSLAPEPLARVAAGESLKVRAARALTPHEYERETSLQSEPLGTIAPSQSQAGMLARCHQGGVVLERVIPPGRREMTGAAYLHGRATAKAAT